MKTKEKQTKGNINQQQQQQKQILYQSEVQCHYHPNERLKYFCKKPNCLQPLCKICLDIHIEEHQIQNDTKEVVTYEKCLGEVSKKMSDNLEQYQEKISQLRNYIERIINLQCPQNWMNLIESSEEQILDLIRSYFNNLKSYLFSISPEINKIYSAQERLLVCSQRLDQLRSEIGNLQNENSVTQIILFYQGDVEKLNNKYLEYLEQTFEDLNKIDFSNIQAPKIKINHTKLNILLEVLNEYINYEQQQEELNEEVQERNQVYEEQEQDEQEKVEAQELDEQEEELERDNEQLEDVEDYQSDELIKAEEEQQNQEYYPYQFNDEDQDY